MRIFINVLLTLGLFFNQQAFASVAAFERDSDNDGVLDVIDHCPNTPAGAKVWSLTEIFETRSSIKFAGCAANQRISRPVLSGYTLVPSNLGIAELPVGTILVSLKPVVLPKSDTAFIVGTSYQTPINCSITNFYETLQIRLGDVFTITETNPKLLQSNNSKVLDQIVYYSGEFELRPETIPNWRKRSTLNLSCSHKIWVVFLDGSRANAFVSVGVLQEKSFYIFAPTDGFVND